MLLYISGVFLAGSISAGAAGSDFKLVGLALHQETGRDIYLGAVYVDSQAPRPADILAASGPRLMEYRVVARRTSIRSLLGGMLLQSEVASGKAPGQATADLANQMLSIVSSSLYAGDSLEILLSENDETIAYLNGRELLRIADTTVANYLLMGWVGERGPTTAFRSDIMAADIKPELLTTLEATTYSEQRAAQIASWIEAPQESPETGAETPQQSPDTVPQIQSSATIAASATPQPVSEQAPEPVSVPEPEPEPEPEITQTQETMALAEVPATTLGLPEPKPEETTPAVPDPAGPAISQEAVQVASLQPTTELRQTQASESIQALDVQEYSQRLSKFHSQLIAMVYGEIRYPARAVRRGLQGRLELDITLQQDGELLAIAIVEPSGYSILDKAAVKAAQNALSSGALAAIDPVAIAEFRNGTANELVVPVPVNFMLTE